MKKISIISLILLLIIGTGYFFWRSGKLDQFIKPSSPKKISEEIIQKNQTLPYEERKLKTGNELGLKVDKNNLSANNLTLSDKTRTDGEGNIYNDPDRFFKK